MRETVNFHHFEDAFRRHGRHDQLGGHHGLRALFDFIEEFEADTGEQLELDVIGLCSDWAYYENAKACADDYDRTLDELRNDTLVLDVHGGGYLVQHCD